MTSSQRPPLLLVGSGSALRHEQLLSDLSRRASLILLQPGPVDWQQPYVHRFAEIDVSDVRSVLSVVRALARDCGFDSVVTYDEALLPLVGRISHEVGLRGLSRRAASVVRDKHAQRMILSQHGARAVRSELVFDARSGQEAAARLGYPVVIKPRSFSGNLGIRIVSAPRDFGAMFLDVMGTSLGGVTPIGALVEEFLEGPEFSIDCWTLDGRASALFTARILTDRAPHLIDVGSVVAPDLAGPRVVAALEEAACAAALTCGVDRTIANVDVKWTRGEPRVLEVNGRPGGLLPHLALLTSGIRVGEVLADVALGRRPDPSPAPRCAAGFAFIYPPRAAQFAGLAFPPELMEADWLARVQATRRPGDRISPPSDDPWGHVGWALVTGESADLVTARIETVRKSVRVIEEST